MQTPPRQIEVYGTRHYNRQTYLTWAPLNDVICAKLSRDWPNAPDSGTERVADMFTRVLEMQVALTQDFTPIVHALEGDVGVDDIRFVGA